MVQRRNTGAVRRFLSGNRGAGVTAPPAFTQSFNFISSESLDPKITPSGGANGTRVNSAGTIVAAVAPRFDYDPVSKAARGLLIEESRTNNALNSEAFDGWGTKVGATVTANALNSPAATLTADKFVEDISTGAHILSRSNVLAANTLMTFSVYVAAAGRTAIALYITDAAGTNYCAATFDLVTKVTAVFNGGTGTGASAAIVDAGNGYFRCSIAGVPVAAGGANITTQIYLLSGAGGSYTGDGASGVHLWGAQLEPGGFASSYIAAAAAAVTRTADLLAVTGTNFSSWFNATEGTFYVNSMVTRAVTLAVPTFDINDGTANAYLRMFYRGSGASGAQSVDSAVSQCDLTPTGVLTPSVNLGMAFGYKLNNFGASGNGGAAVTDISGTVPAVNQLLLGSLFGGNFVNGYLRSFAYIPSRVTDAQLALLSAAAPPPPTTLPWQPSDLGAQLLAQWDAEIPAKVTLNGSTVSEWYDTVTNAKFAQATAGFQPLFEATGLNGRPCIKLDGVDDYMDIAGATTYPTGAVGSEIWVLTDQLASGADNTVRIALVYGGTTAGLYRRLAKNNAVPGLRCDDGTNLAVVNAGFTGIHVARGTYQSSGITAAIDGGAAGTAGALGATGTTRTRLGAAPPSVPPTTGFYNGRLNTVIITTPLSAPDALSLLNWMKARGGIP